MTAVILAAAIIGGLIGCALWERRQWRRSAFWRIGRRLATITPAIALAGAGFAKAVKAASEFEEAMQRVRAVGMTAAEARDRIHRFMENVPMSPNPRHAANRVIEEEFHQ